MAQKNEPSPSGRQDQIEITDEMVEVGVAALQRVVGTQDTGASFESYPEACAEVYKLMLLAAKGA